MRNNWIYLPSTSGSYSKQAGRQHTGGFQNITNSLQVKLHNIYVIGFWKTDRIVTLGLFHVIGPAKGHTRTLHIRSAITRLGGLVCFSRASFADHVNS